MKAKPGIVILGNGAAGNSAAEAVRSVNQQIPVTIITEEPFEEYSACVLPDYIAGEIEEDKVIIKRHAEYEQNNISLITGQRVKAIYPASNQILLAANKIPYHKLILATGSLPSIPPIKGMEETNLLSFKSLNDAKKILTIKAPKKFLIMGGGVIGVELAVALRKKGNHVILIEFMDSILPRVFSPEIGNLIADDIKENGIDVIAGEKIVELIKDGGSITAKTETQSIECDEIIAATGMVPDIGLAQKAGLKTGSLGGIAIDDTMKTSVPDIYACGDCIESKDIVSEKNTLSMLWPNAMRQGKAAGLNCLGIESTYPGSINLTGIDLYNKRAVSMGKVWFDESEAEHLEILEDKGEDFAGHCFFVKSRFCGFQYYGNIGNLGFLIQSLLKNEPLDRVKELLNHKGKILPDKFETGFNRCFLWNA